ncbi:MAG: thiol-disulfide oxidoreductase DCC family protein [Blastocatellales bacterium]
MNRINLKAGKDYLFFDGDCGICTWSAEAAKRIDAKQQFVIEPYQSVEERELMGFGINYDKCAQKLQVITTQGRVRSGAFGVNYFLWRQFPYNLLIVVIYALPLLLLLEIIGYRLVASNRHLISNWLGMKACSIRR